MDSLRRGDHLALIRPRRVGTRSRKEGYELSAGAPVTSQWPGMLWMALALPALVVLYFWLLRRRKKTDLRYASLTLVKQALGKGAGWRRHLPATLFLIGLAAFVVAASRPMAVVELPTQQRT